jgi:hypothetical protein
MQTQRDQAEQDPGRYRDQRERQQFARDAALARRHLGACRQLDRRSFSSARDSAQTSIT